MFNIKIDRTVSHFCLTLQTRMGSGNLHFIFDQFDSSYVDDFNGFVFFLYSGKKTENGYLNPHQVT